MMFDELEVEVRGYTVVARAERVPDGVVGRLVIPRSIVAPGIRVWCVATEEGLELVLQALHDAGLRDDDLWVAFEDGLGASAEDEDDDASDDRLVTPWLVRREYGQRVYVARAT